jgi:uroporphyrinogen-III synthase
VTGPLDGCVVVVTRPERQAGRFKDLVRELGGEVVAFPTLAIEPLPLDEETLARLAPDAYDWVVYTSANAVEFSVDRLGRPGRARVAAIGSGTARALAARGIEVHAVPAAGADSEGLLALPAFAAPQGLRVLIVKGAGGRDALRTALTARGAAVAVAEAYRRVVAHPPPWAFDSLRSASTGRRAVVAVTSVEVLGALLELAPESAAPGLRDVPLLVPGGRVAAAARDRGWRGPLLIAASAEDEAMLATLQRRSAPAGPGGAA